MQCLNGSKQKEKEKEKHIYHGNMHFVAHVFP